MYVLCMEYGWYTLCTYMYLYKLTCTKPIIPNNAYSSSLLSVPGIVLLTKDHMSLNTDLSNPLDTRIGNSVCVLVSSLPSLEHLCEKI